MDNPVYIQYGVCVCIYIYVHIYVHIYIYIYIHMYFMFKFIFAIPYSTPGGLEINEAGCSTPWTTSLVDRQKKPDRKVSTMRRLDMTGE